MSSAPSVSVVCATYRRPASVARLLRALEQQDLPAPFEVVISDDGSGPEAQAELREVVRTSPLPVVLLEHDRNRGPGAARNDGWRAAAGDVIAFTDDDCQPAAGWLREGLAALATADVVVGRVSPDPAQAGRLGPWARTLTVGDARYFQTANAFYRRSDLEAVGGFDEGFVLAGGEDTDLGLRVVALGRTAVFAPRAHVLHDVRAGSVRLLAREAATKWVDLPLVLRKHPQLRETVAYRRLFWKASHPRTLLVLAALPLALWHAELLALALPWVWFRVVRSPRAPARLRRLTMLPGTLAVDVAEVVACVRGSVRHRTVLL